MKRIGIAALAVLVAGCGGQANTTQASQSQAAMLHSMLSSKNWTPTPTPGTSAAMNPDLGNSADNTRFIEALKALPLKLQPEQQVVLGRLVCAGLKQNPNATQAELIAGIEANTAGALDPSQAAFIAATAIDVYCPKP